MTCVHCFCKNDYIVYFHPMETEKALVFDGFSPLIPNEFLLSK